MIFIKNNKLFSCLYLLAVVITTGLVYSLGFRKDASQIAIPHESLPDFTFPIWEQLSFSQHGFLVFSSMEDYANKILQFNHATDYLFYMDCLYKVKMYVQALPLRVTGAFPTIISLAGATFFFLPRLVEKRVAFCLAKPSPAALGFWAMALMYRMCFHLQQIAQLRCQGCYYPGAWNASTKQP